MIESDTKAFQSPLKCSYLTFRGQHSSRESHTYFNVSTHMRPENVHGYTFPNALTSFAAEERSKDNFTLVILSLVVFITSDETACQSANCHQPSL